MAFDISLYLVLDVELWSCCQEAYPSSSTTTATAQIEGDIHCPMARCHLSQVVAGCLGVKLQGLASPHEGYVSKSDV